MIGICGCYIGLRLKRSTCAVCPSVGNEDCDECYKADREYGRKETQRSPAPIGLLVCEAMLLHGAPFRGERDPREADALNDWG